MAGLAVAGLPERIGYEVRALVAAGGLFVLSLPLLWVDTIGALVLAVMALGFAVAPYMISNFTLAGHIVPPAKVGAAMTMLAGATGVGPTPVAPASIVIAAPTFAGGTMWPARVKLLIMYGATANPSAITARTSAPIVSTHNSGSESTNNPPAATSARTS